MAKYTKKLDDDIRCPLEYGLSVVPILQSICKWSDIFYKEDSENVMTQCQKCDYHR